MSQLSKPASKPVFRGNKAGLPQKPCVHCGLPMVWRKRWARNWSAVKFCSERCRRAAPSQPLQSPRSSQPS